MSRPDYNEIKEKFAAFVSTWKIRDTDLLNNIVDPEVACYMSIAKDYPCGSQHTVFGVKDFVRDIPKSDVLHSRICNYICRIANEEAQQSAHVICMAVKLEKNKEPDIKTYEFTAMFSNHWRKSADGWVMDEIRMDVLGHGGNFEEFTKDWYFERPDVVYYAGIHYPCINGELDSPWTRIPEAEDILSDKEQIIEAFACYAFGIDNLAFNHVDKVLTEDAMFIGPPFNALSKRGWIEAMKFRRQKDRNWTHPGKPGRLVTDDYTAHLTMYRMSGHRQRKHPYVYTKENIDIEHACARYELDYRKENGVWKICKGVYYLGIIELGEYMDDLYGDV